MRVFYSSVGGRAAAYALLRFAWRETYGGALPAVAKTPAGKPYCPSRPDVHFSLSHSRGHVMVALGSSPCGCDVEEERPVSAALRRRVAAEEELAQFAFLELWTLKESMVKYRGGPDAPMASLRFTRADGAPRPADGSACAALYPVPGAFAAAVAAEELPSAAEFVPPETLSP